MAGAGGGSPARLWVPRLSSAQQLWPPGQPALCVNSGLCFVNTVDIVKVND